MPVAYGLARLDASGPCFGHVNAVGAVRPLPATVLASVCGYVSTTATFPLNCADVQRAVQLLTPAEAATHIPHPNLWSWRALLENARPSAEFRACFVANENDAPFDEYDMAFRLLI
jgi:hypothetical protein